MVALSVFQASSIPKDSLLAAMAIDVAVNEKSGVWVLHDKPFAANIHHIEYSPESGAMNFHADNGHVWPLGMPVPRKTREKLKNACRAELYYIPDGKKIEGFKAVPLIQMQQQRSVA